MSKLPKSALTLKQFLLQQEVKKLYRDIFRTIRKVPHVKSRVELKEWARSDFKSNMHHTDELVIKMMLQHGRRALNELQTSLALAK